jgi:hypothetical protein
MTHVNAAPTELNFTREQSWVAHVAVLARLERALAGGDGPEAYRARALLATIEADDGRYAPGEVTALAAALETYLEDDPPDRDLDPGWSALRRVDSARGADA